MPTEFFKTEGDYRRWTAYRHMHGIAAPHLETAVVAGVPHKVEHSEKPPRKSKYRDIYLKRKGK